ncbi:MAG: hypothetical protein RMJ55_02635 [Roseiflexaceae bacterium]|nr:hypothetical protein [Roseiflexus sp.]MDW8212428.1 hypothetical protein [Roseiflexaceae bacterium]
MKTPPGLVYADVAAVGITYRTIDPQQRGQWWEAEPVQARWMR